jgi:hypothetical protein
VARELLLVEGVVRRRDRRDCLRARPGCVLGEGDAVGSRLRAAVDDEGQPPCARLDEELGSAPPFLERQEQAFARCAQCKDAVEPVVGEEVDEGRERVLVELRPTLAEGRHGRSEGAFQHA